MPQDYSAKRITTPPDDTDLVLINEEIRANQERLADAYRDRRDEKARRFIKQFKSTNSAWQKIKLWWVIWQASHQVAED